MDKIVPGLLIAAVSALTFVAYKHPDGYQRLIKPIQYFGPLLFTAVVAYDVGIMRATVAILPSIGMEKMQEARSAAENAQILNVYIVGAYFVGFLYLLLLSFLHEILGDEKPPKRKSNPK